MQVPETTFLVQNKNLFWAFKKIRTAQLRDSLGNFSSATKKRLRDMCCSLKDILNWVS